MSNLDLVKRAYKAWETKDEATLLDLLDANYHADMPGGMTIDGHEGAKEMLKNCPNDCTSEDELYVEQGDNIVRMWTAAFHSPHSFKIRMCELNVVKNGKILRNEAFFDSSSFPQEMQDEFKQSQEQKQHATSARK